MTSKSVVHPKSSSLRNSDLLKVSNFTELSPTLEEERRKQFTEYRNPNLDPNTEAQKKKTAFNKLARLPMSRDQSPNTHQEPTPVIEDQHMSQSNSVKVLSLDTDKVFDQQHFATARNFHRGF